MSTGPYPEEATGHDGGTFYGRREPDELLEILRTAPVIETLSPCIKTRSYAAIVFVTLEGDIKAFWKRGDVDPPGIIGVRREVAAYELACILGWTSLLPVVAHRIEPVADGRFAEIASCEFISGIDDVGVAEFSQDEIEKAAVFDALIANPDRLGHNWRACDAASTRRLRLYDHELAFAVNASVNSSFWNHIERKVPEWLRLVLSAKMKMVEGSSTLSHLLPDDEFCALVARMRNLAVDQPG